MGKFCAARKVADGSVGTHKEVQCRTDVTLRNCTRLFRRYLGDAVGCTFLRTTVQFYLQFGFLLLPLSENKRKVPNGTDTVYVPPGRD